MTNELWTWTEKNKNTALEEGYVCCEYYFVCWDDPPPYERGACCKHMKDVTWKDGKLVPVRCSGCQCLRDKLMVRDEFIERKLEEDPTITILYPWVSTSNLREWKFNKESGIA